MKNETEISSTKNYMHILKNTSITIFIININKIKKFFIFCITEFYNAKNVYISIG